MHVTSSGTGLVAGTPRTITPFRLYRPATVADAVHAWSEDAGDAAYLAGGTDLVAQLRAGRAVRSVVALHDVVELRAVVAEDGGGLRLGAGVTHADGSAHPLVRRRLPGLAAAWAQIASVRIRFRATLGGNLLARTARCELPIILDAIRAQTRIATPGEEVAVAGTTADSVPNGALLVAIVVPEVDDVWFSYDRRLRRVLSVATAIRRRDGVRRVRVAVGSQYRPPHAVEAAWTSDRMPDDVAEELAAALPDGIGDPFTSASYRRHASAALVRRQLTRFLEEGAT